MLQIFVGFLLYRLRVGSVGRVVLIRLDSYQLSDLLDLSKMPHEFSFSGEDTDFASSDDFDGTSDDDDIAGGDGDDDEWWAW